MPAEKPSSRTPSSIVFFFLVLLSSFLSGEAGNDESAFVPSVFRNAQPVFWFAGLVYGAALALWLSLCGESRILRLFLFILASTAAYFLAVELVFVMPGLQTGSIESIVLAGGFGAVLFGGGYSLTIKKL